ncbi:MAG: hypothetical protein JEZ10_02370 [Verrucomicrobia bacterium]|nr:hypothetical protein [Verrucomicrobiota bacterium]
MGLLNFIKRQPDPLIAEIRAKMDKDWLEAFPHGDKQVEEESAQLHSMFSDKLSLHDARQLTGTIKLYLVISKDKSEDQIFQRILDTETGSKLTPHEVELACRIFMKVPLNYNIARNSAQDAQDAQEIRGEKEYPSRRDWFDFGNKYINGLVYFLFLVVAMLLWAILGPICAVVITIGAFLGLVPTGRNPFNTNGRW